MIDKLLKFGKITSISSTNGKGTTKEVHIAKYNHKKYLLRICKDNETAKRYLTYYNLFKKYNFFPKLLEVKDNYLLFEFIIGRDCREKESPKIIFQIGKICGIINKIKSKYDYNSGFFKKLNSIRERKVLSAKKVQEINKIYNKLNKNKLKSSLDAGDVTNDNFRVSKNKVYFIDIEAIKPNIKGYGIAKSFSSWFKSDKEKKHFEQGYNSVNNMNFFNETYGDLTSLIFFIHRISYKSSIGDYSLVKITINKLNKILRKWKN